MSDTAPQIPAPLSPLHDLLSAIVDTLDVPFPADPDDERAYQRLLEYRVWQLRGYLQSMVDNQREPSTHSVGVRRMASRFPVTYTPRDRGVGQ